MKKKIYCIIPAQEKNRFDKKGDLAKFSGISLLEWKISQLKKVKKIDKIFVLSSSKVIKKTIENLGVFHLNRPKKHILDIFKFVGCEFKNSNILWANPSSPFVKISSINKFISAFVKSNNKKNGLVTVKDVKEFLIINNKFYNTILNKNFKDRDDIKNIKILTNGLYLSEAESYTNGFPFNFKLNFFTLDWFESLEVKECYNTDIYNSLIENYFKSGSS